MCAEKCQMVSNFIPDLHGTRHELRHPWKSQDCFIPPCHDCAIISRMDENSCDKRSFHGVCCCLRQCLQHTLSNISWNKTLCVRSSRELRNSNKSVIKEKRNKQTQSRLWLCEQFLFSAKSAGRIAKQVSASAWQWAWQETWASEEEWKLRLFCSYIDCKTAVFFANASDGPYSNETLARVKKRRGRMVRDAKKFSRLTRPAGVWGSRASHSRITLTALPAFQKWLFCSLLSLHALNIWVKQPWNIIKHAEM